MKKIIISAFAALFAVATFAQTDSLNAVVKVENDYNPVIVKAVKQSFTPQIEMPTDNTPLDLVFSRSATPFERFISNRDLTKLLPGQEPVYNGYARLGYGNCNNTDAKLGYRLNVGANDVINLFASLTGFSCDIDGATTGNWKSRYYDTWLTADYTHRFRGLSMTILGGVNNSVFNYQPSEIGIFPLMGTDKQHNNDYRLMARVKSHLAGPISYNANIGYQLHTRKYSLAEKERISENQFTAGGEFALEIDNEQLRSLGIETTLDAFTYNDALQPQYGDNKYDDYVSVRVNPFMNFRFDIWKLRLGLHADVLTANGKKIAFAPDVKFEGPLSENLIFYANATGGNKLNTFASFNELSPYWGYGIGSKQLTPTYEVFDVETGLRMGFEPLDIHLFMGYDYSKYNLLPTATFINPVGLIYTDFVQDDTQKYYIGGKVSYDYSGWLNVTADARYNKWNCDGADERLIFTPMIEANAKARARLYDGLYCGLGYNYVRYTKGDSGRIKDMNNLNANISYKFHKQFNAYIQADNLLNKDYFSYAGYKARGINFLAGVEYDF
ncbi:MAG: TonB-dependent receptor [Bacteroidaceae bacterium]|nr:TonB-dependent receptor [Bacteroidaceae bacterium]